jgi:hypothetical protein
VTTAQLLGQIRDQLIAEAESSLTAAERYTLIIGPGEPEHPIGGQPEITEHRPKRLTRVDGVEELLPYLDGQACLRSGSSPGSLGVAVRSPAMGAVTSGVPTCRRAVH